MPIIWTTKVCVERPDARIETRLTERDDTFCSVCGDPPTLEVIFQLRMREDPPA
jgi:hypothetical protein